MTKHPITEALNQLYYVNAAIIIEHWPTLSAEEQHLLEDMGHRLSVLVAQREQAHA